MGLLQLLLLNILGEYKSDHSKNIYELIDISVDPAFRLMRFPLDDGLDFYFEK